MFDAYLGWYLRTANRSSVFLYSMIILSIAQDRTNNGDLLDSKGFRRLLYRKTTRTAKWKGYIYRRMPQDRGVHLMDVNTKAIHFH